MSEVDIVAEMRGFADALERVAPLVETPANLRRWADHMEGLQAREVEAFKLIGDLRKWRRWHKPSVRLSRDDIPPNQLSEESLFRRIDHFISSEGDSK